MLNLKESFFTAQKTLNDFVADETNIQKIEALAKDLANTFQNGGKTIIFGNGGSACDAAHYAEEFTGRYRKHRPSLPAIAFNEPGHLTCVGNDYGFDEVFSRPTEAFCQKGDVVIGLSTSGNSTNVLKALNTASEKGAITVALIGKDGGKMKGLFDYEWIIPGETSDRIQELHMMILHILIEGVERILYPENY